MTYDEFDVFCNDLPATTRVVQWGGSRVWKVGGKVFAVGGWDDGSPGYTFKVDSDTYDLLSGQPGLRPAPYLASRGMSWIQHFSEPGLPDDQLKQFLRGSHELVSLGLTKKKRKELGLRWDHS